jgi:restriction endonuclease S subunit
VTNKEEISFEDGKRKLPDGWRWVKLGDVCEVIMGQSPPGNSYNSKPSTNYHQPSLVKHSTANYNAVTELNDTLLNKPLKNRKKKPES